MNNIRRTTKRRSFKTAATIVIALSVASARPVLAAGRPSTAPGSTRTAAPRSKSTPAPKTLPSARIVLSLSDAVFLGLRNNTSIRSAYVDRVAQRFDLFVAEDQFTPHAVLQGTATRQLTAGAITNSVSLSPAVAVLTPLGTSFTFSWDNSATETQGNKSIVSAGTATLIQPLLRGAGPEVNLAPVRTARLTENINQLRLRQTIQQSITDIISAYRELIRAQQAEKLAEDSVTGAQAIIDVDQNLIAAGRMARTEVVQAQAYLELLKLQVLQSKSTIQADRLALAVLLNLDLGTRIDVQETLHLTRPAIDLDQTLRIAFLRRPDYLIQQDVVEQAKLGIMVANNQRLWDVSLIGSARLGREYDASPGSRFTAIKIGDGLVGARLTIPLNDPTLEQTVVHANGSFQDAGIQLNVIRQGIEQQIRASASDIAIRWQQLEISHNAEALAANAVDIERQKLSVGRSTTFQVQSLEEAYRNARNQRLNAEIDYANALSLFDLQVGTTLDTWKISLRDQ